MAEETFEGALKKLESIVEKLEKEDLGLDESLKAFEEGVKLSRFCSNKLDEAEKKVEILLRNEKGELKAESFKIDDES